MHSAEQEKGLSVQHKWERWRGRDFVWLVWMVFVASVLGNAFESQAADLTLFGPKTYSRVHGKPATITDSFSGCASGTSGVLRLANGSDKDNRVSSAVVILNGKRVIGEHDLNKKVPALERTVALKPGANILSVTVKSGEGDDDRHDGKNHHHENGVDTKGNTDGHDDVRNSSGGNSDKAGKGEHHEDHGEGNDDGHHEGDDDHRHDPALLVIEILGRGCDAIPPTISTHQPIDGTLLNIARPVVSASYSDNSGGSGVDIATVRVSIDGGDISNMCSVTATDVTCALTGDLADGTHTATVVLSDLAMNPSSSSWRFTTDTTPPQVAVTAPQSGQHLGNPVISVTGIVDDPTAKVTVVSTSLGAATSTTLAMLTGLNFSAADVPLSEGANTLTVTAVDQAGNRSTMSVDVTLDTSLPVVTITAPVNGSFTSVPMVNVSGSVSEAPAGVTVNGRAAVLTGQAFILESIPLAEGQNTISIEARDLADNRGIAVTTVTLDTVNPQIFVTVPADGLLTRNPQLTVSGTISELLTSLTVNGQPATITGQTFSTPLTLNEGANSLILEAADRAGNKGNVQISVTLDSTPPSVPLLEVLTSPTNNPIVVVKGSAEPGSSVALSAGAVQLASTTADASGLFSFSNITLTEGETLFTVQATDQSGNAGQPSAPLAVILDTVAPSVAINTPLDGTSLNTPTITVSGSIDDPTAVVTVNGLPAINSGDIWTLEGFTLQEGSNILLVEARDPAGNKGSAGAVVTLDTIPPSVTVTTPVDGLYTNMTKLSVNGETSETVATVKVTSTSHNAGTTLTATVVDQGFSLSDLTLLEGANSITVEATDLAGNRGTATVGVILDTIAPQLTVIGPDDGALLNNGQITFGGSAAEPVVSVLVNGITASPDPSGTGGYTLPVTLVEGSNTLTITATDRAGNRSSSTITVNLDSTAPAAPLFDPLTTPTRSAATTVSGKAEANATVKLFNNGQLIATLKADAAGLFSVAGVNLNEGNNPFTAQATDAAGNAGLHSLPLTVVLDTKAPLITVSAPQPGMVISAPQVSITGTVDETLASLTINGASTPLGAETLGFEYMLALAAGENSALITATDLAGNVATTTVIIQRDSTPPKVVISAPLNGLLTNIPQIHVVGTVDDADAALTVGGGAVSVSNRTFTASYLLSDGENSIQAKAVDKAGNEGSASVLVTLDAQPPVVTLNAPATATAGTDVQIAVNATDNRGLTLVDLSADGASLWSGTPDGATIGQSVSLRLSPALTPGATVTVRGRALDAAGNSGSATTVITIDKGADGPGWLQGKVLDDSRGLPLEGAQVSVTDSNGVQQSSTTPADGAWFFELASGAAKVEVVKSGFTTVRRDVSVRPGQRTSVLDSRLTKLDGTIHLIDATGGSAKFALVFPSTFSPQPSAAAIDVQIPAGALSTQADLRLTPLSNQGLIAPLPAGWSPLAVLDLRLLVPTTATPIDPQPLTAPAVLTLPLPTGLGDAALTAQLARYDNSRRGWLATAEVAIAAKATVANVQISQPGQYALLLADPAPSNPPAPASGQELAAVTLQPSDFSLITTTGRVVPQAALPSVGLRAAGDLLLVAKADAATAPLLTSGLVINARVTEKFDLTSGDKLQPASTVQDIVLYRAPCVTSIACGATEPPFDSAQGPGLRTTFPVAPSRDFTIVDLLLGKISIEITPPDSSGGIMVGADGARLLQPDGTALSIPAGALSGTVPVTVNTLPEASIATLVGADFRLLRGVELGISGQLLRNSATISIPVPAGFDPALPVVVAKKFDVKGGSKLKLVAAAKPSGSIISSEPLTPELSNSMNSTNSINSSGVYCFLQATAPIGYVAGQITDSANAPFAGIQVSAQSATLADLTGVDGQYLLALAAGSQTVTALDPARGDAASGTVAISANTKTTLNLAVLMTPPTVISIFPANSATNVQPSVPVVVTFSKPMDKNTINSTTLKLSNSTNTINSTTTWNAEATVASFYPVDAFKQETTYGVTISATVRDLQGYPLGQDVTSLFTVRRVTPPVMPPAGAVSGTFPDADGFISVTGSQGSAEAGNTVLLINDTTGEIQSVTPASNGSFSGKVRGQLGDEIKVVLMDYSGNQTTISYITFKSPDGSYLVTAKGGKVEGEGGSLLDIPEGALVGPTVIRLTTVQEANLPHPLQMPGKYLGAVNIDTGGIDFRKEVHLSIPVPAGFNTATAVFVTRPSEVLNAEGGVEKVYEIIDSTKIINGRITTASPPFDGITGIGSYVFTGFPEVTVGIVSGYTYQNRNELPGYQPAPDGVVEIPVKDTATGTLTYQYDRPIQRAVIRTPAAWNYVSYSNSKGFYAGFTTLYGNVGAPSLEYNITAIHPLTMRRVNLSAYLSADGSSSYNIKNLNFKLADKDTFPPDRTAPIINMSLDVLSGQPATARIVAGTTPVGTKFKLPVSVIDQKMGLATLTIKYQEPGSTTSLSTPVTLTPPSSPVLHATILEELLELYRYDYQAGFDSGYFAPELPGYYAFTVEAIDDAKNRSSRSIQLRAVAAGTNMGTAVEGAPRVLSISPEDGVKGVAVTSPVIVTFSEPVQGLENAGIFTLYDLKDPANPVDATVTAGISGGVLQATLTPKGNLFYGRDYKVVLTASGIRDTTANASGSTLPMAQDFISFFRTKDPGAYDLASDQQFTGGRDIDLYTTTDSDGVTNTYAYIAASDKGWRIVDVTDPTAPVTVFQANSTCPTDNSNPACRYLRNNFDMRSVAVHPDKDKSIMAMTDNFAWGGSIAEGGIQYGYVRFYDLTNSPKNPQIVGREVLAEAYSGIPGRLALWGDYAVVNSAVAGVQIVNVKQAIKNQKEGKSSDGSSIAGVLDTEGQGYGSPSDLKIFNERSAVFTTNPGYLLSVDLNIPTDQQNVDDNIPFMPVVLNAFKPDNYRFTRVGAASAFSYVDADGNSKTINLAVTGSAQGMINTIDLTDPTDPRIIGTATDNGVAVSVIAYDIIVSKDAGLAYVTTSSEIQLYDIKDPTHPRLLNKLPFVINPDGVSVGLANSPAIAEIDGWLYLASQAKGMVALDLSLAPPCIGGPTCNYGVERVFHHGQFDTPGLLDYYTDGYRIVDFKLTAPAKVMALLYDGTGQQKKVIVPEETLAAGTYNFIVDYDTIHNVPGIDAKYAPGYAVSVIITPEDGSAPYKKTVLGRINERTDTKMLGNTVVHDVMLHDGSLNLTRQDFAFAGRGPQLSFARSYTNQNSGLRHRPLGNGWGHTLDMRLIPGTTNEYSGSNALPDWVPAKKGIFYDPATLVAGSTKKWTSLTVNNTPFKKTGDTWNAGRGSHGTLTETAGGFIFTAKDGTQYSYDAPVIKAGSELSEPTLVKTITDRNGNTMTFSYTPSGHLDKVTDAVGRSCSFSYDFLNNVCDPDPTRLVSVTCSDNVTIRFTYDGNGNLRSAVRGERSEEYEYAPEAGTIKGDFNLVKTTYATASATKPSYRYAYFGKGELATLESTAKALKSQDVIKNVTYPPVSATGTPATVTFSYTGGNSRTVTDALNNATVYTLNKYGNPLQIAEPLGRTTTMTWSIDESKPDNVMTSRTDGNGKKTTFEYDSKGNITKETDPLGNSITTSWNLQYSQPLSRSDRNGKTQSWAYDSKGNLIKQTDGEGKSTSHGYNGYGERISTTDPRSNSTSYTYDSYGNPATTTGAEGSITSTSHDIRGRLTESTDPNGNKTSYTYNTLDYPQSVTYPALTAYTLGAGSTNVKTTVYDPLGNLIRETGRTGLTLDYSYTPRNQVASVKRSGAGLADASRTFDYDNNGNLTTESDWKNNSTSHTYDALNRRITTSNRLGFSMTMGYDNNNNLTSEKDFEGRETKHDYDALNRRIRTVQPALPGAASGELKYSYYNESDPKTNLKMVTDQEGNTTTFEYNGRYQKAKQIDALSGVHLWEYDNSGNLSSETDEENRTTSFDYDKQNRMIKQTRPLGAITAYQYDAAGNRTATTDPNGNVTEQQYDQWNRLWKTITPADPVKYETTTELDGEGRAVKTTDANNVSRSQSRDARGLVTSSIDGEGNTTSFTYDANGNTLTVTEPNSTVTTNTYDAEDRLLAASETGATATRSRQIVSRDKVGNPTEVKDYNGNSTTTTYNALNLPTSTTDALGKTTTSGYFKTGKIKSVNDRRGNSTTYEYDALNRLSKVTDPLSQTTETGYDKVGNVTTIKDKRGIVTENSYDALNRLTEQKRDNTRLVTNEYDAAGNKTAVIDANGNKTIYTFTKRNLVDTTTFADATTRTQTYDGNGNTKTATDELGKVTSYSYDKENRQTAITFANETTSKEYDAVGSVTKITKPLGTSKEMSYDGFKRLTQVVEGTLTTDYDYDNNGNQTKQSDPNGNETTIAYDALNRTTSRTLADGSSTSYFYDEEGNLTKSTDPKGQVINHVYDAINRHTETTYPGNTSPYLALTKTETVYDGNNNITTVTESKTDATNASISDVTGNTYDNFDRLTASTQRGVQVSYSYDTNGNRTGVTTPNGATAYTYNNRNRLETASTTLSTSATTGGAATSFAYYADGKKKTATYPNGASENLDYYDTNRIKTISNKAGTTVISSFDYDYDKNGNRTKQTELQSGLNRITSYSYDNIDRLQNYTVTVGTSSGTTDYSYDGYNRKTEKLTENTVVTSDKTYSYDSTNRLTSVTDSANSNTISYTYDANGNTIKKNYSALAPAYADTFFDYDVLNRLVQVKQGSGATAAVLGQYDYDENNLRIRHRNSERGNVDYFHDGRSIIEERNSNDNSLIARYSYADKLLSLVTPAGSQYFHHDALGSTVNLTSESGATQASYALDPWGHIVSQQGDSVNRQVFTGKEIDWNTGLVYFGARYYDPDTARFINQDDYLGEQDEPPSLHRYLYAYSNPLVYVDLYGNAAQAIVQPAFYSETDLFGSSPVRDTGNQIIDNLWAGVDDIANTAKYVVNGLSGIASIPTIAYAKAKDISVSEANQEIVAAAASTGPLAPYLLTGSLPFRIGPALGCSARTISAKMTLSSEARAGEVVASSVLPEKPTGLVQQFVNKAKSAYESSLLGNEVGAVGNITTTKGADSSWNIFQNATKGKFENSTEAAQFYKRLKAGDYDAFSEFAEISNVSTKKNGAVFWTGFDLGNKQTAMSWASKSQKEILEMTPGGKWLDMHNSLISRSLSPSQADAIWLRMSERFTTGASGEVNAFTRGTINSKNKVFYGHELPNLFLNREVTSIKYWR